MTKIIFFPIYPIYLSQEQRLLSIPPNILISMYLSIIRAKGTIYLSNLEHGEHDQYDLESSLPGHRYSSTEISYSGVQ